MRTRRAGQRCELCHFDAKVPDKNGAGIRQEGNKVTIRNCCFHDCENGILGGGDATSSVAGPIDVGAYESASPPLVSRRTVSGHAGAP